MSIKIGTNDISDMKVGSSQVSKVMLNGKNLVDAINASWVNNNTVKTLSDNVFKFTCNSGVLARACLPINGLVSGTTYTVSFEAYTTSKPSTPSDVPYARVRETSSGGEWISNRTDTIRLENSYSKYTLTFTATSVSNPYVWFYLSTSTSNTNNVELYVKNIQLESGSTPTTYEPYVGEVTLWEKV